MRKRVGLIGGWRAGIGRHRPCHSTCGERSDTERARDVRTASRRTNLVVRSAWQSAADGSAPDQRRGVRRKAPATPAVGVEHGHPARLRSTLAAWARHRRASPRSSSNIPGGATDRVRCSTTPPALTFRAPRHRRGSSSLASVAASLRGPGGHRGRRSLPTRRGRCTQASRWAHSPSGPLLLGAGPSPPARSTCSTPRSTKLPADGLFPRQQPARGLRAVQRHRTSAARCT